MNNIKRLFVFTEADIPSDPRKSKGATTRLIARIAEQIKQQERLEVIYCCVHSDQEVVEPRVNIITNPNAFVDEYGVGSTDAGIFIRYNFEEMLPVLLAFKQRQGIAIAHLSDPHVENTAPTMQARVRLHQKVLSSVDGVIATSEALGAISKKYNKNVVHIPDVVDFSGRLPPKTAFIDNCLKQNLPIKLLSSGYALHHQSFKKALLEAQSFCESEQIKVDYHIVTAEPNTTDKFTHGNHFKKLEKIVAQLDAQSKLRVYLHAPFRTEILEWLLEVVDVSVIPGFANEFLSEFQQTWFPKKGAIRVSNPVWCD